jgi:hypothetical protein
MAEAWLRFVEIISSCRALGVPQDSALSLPIPTRTDSEFSKIKTDTPPSEELAAYFVSAVALG